MTAWIPGIQLNSYEFGKLNHVHLIYIVTHYGFENLTLKSEVH